MSLSAEEKIIQGLEEFADALESDEDISKRFTCHKMVLNLKPTSYAPETVQATRKTLGVSQALFAKFLGVATGTVQRWEQGENKPSPIACRFMDEIRRDPKWWTDRLNDAIVPKAVR